MRRVNKEESETDMSLSKKDLAPGSSALREQAILLYGRGDIDQAISRMAQEINQAIAEENEVLVLSVMNGALFFTAALMPQLGGKLVLDHCHATRYRGDTQGHGLEWRSRPSQAIQGRCVLIVDDILDEGHTLQAIVEYCREQGARRVLLAVLVDKVHDRRHPGLKRADFTGLSCEDYYIFGFGMDYQEHCRHWQGIYRLP
jgi:hypoxanthine phosphoribosyltransferase